jgi:hypothetical protein
MIRLIRSIRLQKRLHSWRNVMRIMKAFVITALALSVAGSAVSQEKEVSLTVYNDNLALVRDVRWIEMKKGLNEISFQDVAAKIDPTSVHFKSLTAPEAVSILEQNFQYDLVNSAKILSKYVDHAITVKGKEGQEFSGKLLSSTGKDIVLQSPDGGVTIVNMATVQNLEFPRLPEGLITRPTLVWTLQADRGGRHRTEVSYLTSGINWHAEYVAVTNADDSRLDLSGWVSIDNKSGATYENARLKLVAGQIHRAVPPPRRPIPLYEATAAKAAPAFEEKAFFEYRLYTLQRPATVRDNEIKQLSLFEPTETRVNKVYVYEAVKNKSAVRVNLEFKNSKAAGLGMPLPKGKIRVYKEDSDKSLIFIGEDFIDHTPKDEQVRVYVGDAFDIVAERKQTAQRKLGDRSREESWQITLRNHKKETVRVKVIEHLRGFGLAGEWEIRKSSHPFVKKDVRTIEFEVLVEPDGESVVEYTVLYRW